MLLLLLPAARRGFLVRLRLRLCSCSMPSMCPLVASSAFALPFLICMLPLPFASLSSCLDACGLLFLSHVPCLLSLFCLFAIRWSWPCASFLELLPFLVSICPFASTIYCLRYSPLLMIYFHFILPCIISCLTYHLICCSSSFLRSVVASWLVCVSGCAPAPCLLCVPWLPPLRLPCLFWSVCSPCLLLPFVLVLMLPVSFSCLMFLACFLCFAFCLSLKLALRFILGASAPPPSCGPSWPPLFISYCLVLYHVSLYHISSHMLLLLLPAARRGFMVRLRLRLCSWSMPSMCPLVASSAFALPFLIYMLPLPFASLCSCPDASGLLFLSHVPCLLSLFCLLQHDTPAYNHASGLSTNVPNPFSNLLIGSLLHAYSVPCFHALATFQSNMSVSCD